MTIPTSAQSKPVQLTGIRASAGAGKTYSLTTAYLKTFFAGAEADSILATTFTRTAAAEILGRVLKRMAEACVQPNALAQLASDLGQPNLNAASVRAQLVRFCRSLDRVAIGTIDSFFAGIASCYKYDFALGMGGSIADSQGSAARRLRIDALRAVLAGQDRAFVLKKIDQLQSGKSARSVINSLDKTLALLLPLYETTTAEAWEFPHLTQPLDPHALHAAVGDLLRLEPPYQHKPFAKGMVSDGEKALNGNWVEFIGGGLVAPIIAEDFTYYKKEIPHPIVRVYLKLIDHARGVLLGDLAAKTQATYHLIELLATEYNALRAASGMIFFADYPVALARLLQEISYDNLSHRLDRRIKHLMLDEFQDTDPLQWQILTPFARQIATSSGGSLFWVGDPKQAIYGWRGARAEIFETLSAQYEGLEWQDLSTSFRSSQTILDAVNRVFANLESCAAVGKHGGTVARWCSGYVTHKAQFDKPGYVEILQSPDSSIEDSSSGGGRDEDTDGEDDDDNAALANTAHLDFSVHEIESIYKNNPGITIGILTRTNAMADALLFRLRRSGVPATALAGAPLNADPAAALVLAALRLADRPGDTFAAFRVLNSPLADSVGLSSLAPRALSAASQRIRQMLTDSGYAATLVEWAKTLAPQSDAVGASRLSFLIELADQYDKTPGTRPRQFIDMAQDSRCLDPTPSRIQIMSIHKAKGLEFDWVVLPELHKKLLTMSRSLLTDTDPATHEITRVTASAPKAVLGLDPHLLQMYEQNQASEMREALSLLYVALTRPRNALTIIIPPPKKPGLSLAALALAQLRDDQEPEAVNTGQRLCAYGDSHWAESLPHNAPVPQQAALDPQPEPTIPESGHRVRRRQAPSSMENWGHVKAEQILAPDARDSRTAGTLLHAFFREVEWSDSDLPSDDLLLAKIRRTQPKAAEPLIKSELAQLRSALAKNAICKALARPVLASGESVELWRERAFATLVDGKFVNGVFDRVAIIAREGKPCSAVLIDYKSGDLSAPMLQEEMAKYKQQMASYAAALCAILRLEQSNIAAKLVFPVAGQVLDL